MSFFPIRDLLRRPSTRSPWALAAGLSIALGACSPSVNPAYKSSIDQRVAALRPSGSSFEAPTTPEPMPLAVGQWSRYQLVDTEGQPGFITYSVVGEDGGAFWIETIQEGYTSRTVSLMLADLGDRRDPGTVDVKQMKQKVDDQAVTELPPALVSMMKPMWKPIVDGLLTDWREKPQEPASVPAGAFDACYKAQATVSFAGKSWTSLVWSHPAVPLSGAVKSQGVDNPGTMQLIEFGTTGATSELM